MRAKFLSMRRRDFFAMLSSKTGRLRAIPKRSRTASMTAVLAEQFQSLAAGHANFDSQRLCLRGYCSHFGV